MQGTKKCACRRGVRTRACRVETHLDAWVSRTEIRDGSGTGVEMSLDAARTSAYATPMPVYLSEQCCRLDSSRRPPCAWQISVHETVRRDKSRRGTHECVRHIGLEHQPQAELD